MTCRPVQTAQNLGITRPTHCSVIVWEWTEDDCGNKYKQITDQYSLERDGTNPNDTDRTSDTFTQDREAFHNGGSGATNTDIPKPPIFNSQRSFDDTVRKNGNNYSQGPYNAYIGPNSNTAAENIIKQSGGNPPSWVDTGGWPGL